MTLEAFLKAAPAVLGAFVALIRVLPRAVATIRKRRYRESSDSEIDIHEFAAPLPWTKNLDERIRPESGQTKLTKRTVTWLSVSVVAVLLGEILYLVNAFKLTIPILSTAISIVLTGAIVGGLASVLVRLRRTANERSGAAPESGHVIIKDCALEDVQRRTLRNIQELGARLVHFDGQKLHAATGVQVNSKLFIGEYIKATIESLPDGLYKNWFESVKLDYITPNRARSNAIRFLEGWLPTPAKAPEAKSSEQTDSGTSGNEPTND